MWVQAVDCLAGRVRPTSWGTRPIIPSDDLVGIDDLNFRKRLQLSYIELGVDSMPSQGRAIKGDSALYDQAKNAEVMGMIGAHPMVFAIVPPVAMT